jgi:tRNA(fMet)-specific endonuclease VapC
MRYLLDTNICVHLLRGHYNVDKAIDRVGWENCCISEITELELKIGVELSRSRDGRDRSDGLKRFLDTIAIIPISTAIDLAAKEKVRLRTQGTPIDDDFDLLIGCTALSNGMVMVTENVKDFKNLKGIQLENWIAR